jgi:hypothetical protein
MFGPSLKSVPGCLVSIVPMLIGVPVAFTPALGPHDDVSLDPLLAVELDELVLPPLLAAGALLVLLLLLPHPARMAAPKTAANASSRRARGTYSNNLTDLSSSSDPGLNPPRFCEARAAILNAASVVCKTSLT